MAPRRGSSSSRYLLAAAAAIALGAGAIGAWSLLLRSSGGNAVAAARDAVCRPADADFGVFNVLSEQEIQASDPDARGGWERDLDSVIGQGFVACDVTVFADAEAAHAGYAARDGDIASGSFSSVLVDGPARTLSLPLLGDESSAYEFRSSEGSARHAVIVVMRTGNAVATIRLREPGDLYTAANAQDVARAVMGRLVSLGYGPAGLPPASTIESPSPDVLQPIAPGDAVATTRTLTEQVGEMNDAQAAFVQALTSNTASAAELVQLQSTLAARSIAVGRAADLLADTMGQSSEDASTAAVAMYGDVATVAYAQALLVADATTDDLIDSNGSAEMIQSIAALASTLSAGEPEYQEALAAALGSSYEDDTIAVPVPVSDGDERPEAVVTRSRARFAFTVEDLPSLITADGVTAAALNAAADPASGATLAQMKAVAAARLSLHAAPALGVSTAPFAAPSKPLSFEAAKHIVMSRGVKGSDSDAALTFFALADADDLKEVFSFLSKGSDATATPNQMIVQAAWSVRGNGGGGGPYVDLLLVAILGKPLGRGAVSDETASTLQRLLFDQYLQLKEPTISVSGARFNAGAGTVGIDLAYEVHNGYITVTCQLSDGAQASISIYRERTATTLTVPTSASGVGRWTYTCWSLYGKIGGGEVEDASHGTTTPTSAAEATQTPTATATTRPAEPPTSEPPPDACPTAVVIDGVTTFDELFKCVTPEAAVAPPPPAAPTPCPPASGDGYNPTGGLASGGPGC